MANTYTQCYFHLVFSVKNRDALIRREWKDELERYVTGIVQNYRHKLLAIGTMPDHVQMKNEVQFKDEYVFEFFNDIHGWD